MTHANRLIFFVCALTIVAAWSSATAQVQRRVMKTAGRHDKNVVRELKLSEAQKEEIRSIVADVPEACSKLKRTLTVLREDYRLAMVKEERDDTEIARLRRDIAETKSAIEDIARQKMKEITSLLTASQSQRLRALRKDEYDRLLEERNRGRGDESSDAPRSPSMMQSFRMFTHSISGDEPLFDPDELFGYPERELWLSDAPSGFGSLPFGGDEFMSGFQSMPDIGSMLDRFDMQEFRFDMRPRGGSDGSDRGRGPSRKFDFRMQVPDADDEEKSGREMPSDDLMDTTPFTLPRPKHQRDSSSGEGQPETKRKMRERIDELKKALESLENELKSGDR